MSTSLKLPPARAPHALVDGLVLTRQGLLRLNILVLVIVDSLVLTRQGLYRLNILVVMLSDGQGLTRQRFLYIFRVGVLCGYL